MMTHRRLRQGMRRLKFMNSKCIGQPILKDKNKILCNRIVVNRTAVKIDSTSVKMAGLPRDRRQRGKRRVGWLIMI